MHDKKCLVLSAFVLIILFVLYEANIKSNGAKELQVELKENQPVKHDNQSKTQIKPEIIDKPVLLTEYRKKLAREYSQMHYGEAFDTIIPQAVIIHWTASDNLEGVYGHFYGEEAARDREYGLLNFTSHFLVDKDGTIYRLTPENCMNRHAIGLNWCSIGIENVGGVNGSQDLTDAQLKSNKEIICYLKEKYPSIKYILGHYQQDKAKKAGLWKENLSGYYTGKIDPGPVFMEKLINETKDLGLVTFEL